MKSKRRFRVVALLIICGVVAWAVALLSMGGVMVWAAFFKGDRRVNCQLEPGSIQVIASDTRLFCIVQFDNVVYWNRSSWDTPPYYPVGHVQVVVALTEGGVETKGFVEHAGKSCGPSINRNISKVFSDGEEIYLYQGPSMFTRHSMFHWTGTRFVLLDDDGVSDLFPGLFDARRSYEVKQKLEGSMAATGYKTLAAANHGWDALSLKFAQVDIEFKLLGTHRGYEIVFESAGDRFDLSFEVERNERVLTEQEARELPGVDHGHRKRPDAAAAGSGA